ncbi:CS12 fimbria chaperone protein [Escherichia coli]|uniref:fimbria/pilus periplasmic chaperone n=1 Tax=Escherichia coli TaxID=562 RepID=UPI00050B22D0|nr:fimbria/pilus periplasmic chaperone [Escherichia coli]MCD9175501.1 fimbria/pilus periplasmic chaperone [Escherichia coli]MCV8715323.1 fimbria/pilus periplasmic chaperone [Escherichia coli]MDF8888025.1 fimbria/pilus periplasmic chaperone [Escherichia coli]MDF8897784.1 fimbria/pilus periplasmic chaperone [Escherichia coli]MDM4028921.1 fimbria/pilus periplasmic chaperone [Escherichia coli]
MKESSVNIFLLTALFLLSLFISAQGQTQEPERGVAVEPMKITVKDRRVFYFTVYNDTDNEYVITARVIRPDGRGETPFALSPPVRLLNKRDDVKVGLIYLPEKKDNREKLYYISVSFIPRQQKAVVREEVSVPLVLEQQIPVVTE